MKILVTGVAGFIGSNLAQALLDKSHQVVGLDNMSQGNKFNMAGFDNHPDFSMHFEDVRDLAALIRTGEGCDVIVHLAAYKIPRYSDALDTLTINAAGSENVARAAVEHGCKVVAASTSDVYGKNPDIPFTEESNLVMGAPTVKRWAYAISKMFEEQLLFAYHERFGIDVVMLRFFGGYGPNQNLTWWGGPQSVFINSALDGEPLTVHGDGQQTRSFTYVSDHVNGIIASVEKPAANNLVFNLGQTREITIADLGRLIWRLVRGEDNEPKIDFIPYETFGKYEDVQRRLPDVNRARDILGVSPRVDIEEGLRKTILWQVARRREMGISTPDPVL
ncbi:MAG: GDP-mannose 4,6-dehydratase [Rhodospirillales bacterium]|jgi:UDP-glucose 4-epimerase|nr:GDP-mannose 4,6-dehydratase [Rhodospirillales bacterium]HIJ44508.1 NAD-dependent epimerase/dehydratase family protein [Rhodospirillaceae bacterium]HIJ93780.1 NAD-dependent epimerase/dehydratase family protein [Rhodospirillaceae bacterium]HJP53352.1 GDP-mannose 4,6-dehydratase [Rhodospirillales bacterium]